MHRPYRGRTHRVLTLTGWVTVRACAYCGALVVAHAVGQHERVHRASHPNGSP